MTLARISLAAVVVIIGAGGSANASEYHHIDDLAVQLQGQARELYNEFRIHYAHAAHAQHLKSDAAAMYYAARHIHELAHFHGSLDHMAYDLRKLDRLFHHVEDLVEHIEHDAFHGDGHVHGDTGHVRALMSQMEDTLHHLRADVNELRYSHFHAVMPIGGHDHDDHDHGGYGHSHGGAGVVFGSGGLRIRFGH